MVVGPLRSHVRIVTPEEIPDDSFSDPEDLPVLGTAVAAKDRC